MRSALICAALAGALLACGEVAVEPSEPKDAGGGGSGASCVAPLADCDHDGTCEATLGTVEHCGGCGDVCSSSHAAASCEAGRCVLACDEGFTDCNGLASDGCEAQLAIDPQNCGTCGASCGMWGDCFQGACVDVLSSAASFAVGADALVIEGRNLYWSSGGIDADGVIASVPLTGGVTTTLAGKQKYADFLRSNGASLVWSDVTPGAIYGMPIAGGAVQTLWQAPDGNRPYVLAVDAASIYFSTGGDVQIMPVAGGAPAVIASGLVEVSAGCLAGGYLYVTDLGPEMDQTLNGYTVPGHPEGTVARVTVASGHVDVLAQHLDTPGALTTTDGALYWVESGSDATYAFGSDTVNVGTLGRVVRAGLDGSSPAVVADQLVQPVDVAADATHVYWAVAGTVGGADPAGLTYVCEGSVMRAPLGGGPAETLVPSVDARRLALSNDTVFFSTWVYGEIMGKAKP